MTRNSYDSSASSQSAGGRRSFFRAHAIASVLVVSLWLVLISTLLWSRFVTVADWNVSMSYTSQEDPTEPYDSTLTTHVVYIDTAGAMRVVGAAVGLSLAMVNGFIVWWRRGRLFKPG